MAGIHPLNAAATVPDVDVFLRDYAAASATAREGIASRCDLRYGPAPLETLDFFSAGPAAPLAAFFHGGYWRRLDKGDFSFIAQGSCRWAFPSLQSTTVWRRTRRCMKSSRSAGVRSNG